MDTSSPSKGLGLVGTALLPEDHTGSGGWGRTENRVILPIDYVHIKDLIGGSTPCPHMETPKLSELGRIRVLHSHWTVGDSGSPKESDLTKVTCTSKAG